MKGIEVVSMIKNQWFLGKPGGLKQRRVFSDFGEKIRRDNEKYRIRKKKNRLGGRREDKHGD